MEPERVRGAFLAALVLHGAIAGGLIYSSWLAGHKDALGAANAGGASVAIEAVRSIPLPNHGAPNPLATDSQSEVPQAPAKPVERVKQEKPPPDAIPLKSPKKPPADVASEKNKFRPYKDYDPYQVYSKSAPAVSNPAFSAKGAGNVGAGPNNTLGNHCPGYAAQIQQLVASHWNTSNLDASLRTAPTVIATFDLMRDGSVHNVHILQASGISPLDASVERAIADSNPLPPILPDCGVDHASAEFWFELKR
jgi:outer membrane biosynthesis protein TonB